MISALLIAAIIQVESAGNDQAIGAKGEIGCLQISAVCLEDVNRFSRLTFSADDCYSRTASIRIFETYIEHYLAADAGEPSWRQIAMTWHHGPHKSTMADDDHYWSKVQQALGCAP